MSKCTNCGRECYYTQSPEIVFTDENNIICEDCSIDFYEADDGTIRKLTFGGERDARKMKFDDMIAALDGATGRLIVPSMRDSIISEAREMILNVSLSLGEWAQELED